MLSALKESLRERLIGLTVLLESYLPCLIIAEVRRSSHLVRMRTNGTRHDTVVAQGRSTPPEPSRVPWMRQHAQPRPIMIHRDMSRACRTALRLRPGAECAHFFPNPSCFLACAHQAERLTCGKCACIMSPSTQTIKYQYYDIKRA